jgi:glycosyltransferase involved in cell wall biosynthesis
VILGQRVVVVMPSFRSARTIERTVRELDRDVVDQLVIVDDASDDDSVAVARTLGVPLIVHPANSGYGASQKSGYREALALGADIVVMVHADYQYTPRLVTALTSMIASGVYDVALGSRILGGGALRGGMPWERYVANRILTLLQNLATGAKLSEYHTGYRAFARQVLLTLPFAENSDGFAFDAELLSQCLYAGFRVGELSCPTRYAPDSSSIARGEAIRYAGRVLQLSAEYASARIGGPTGRTLRGIDPRRRRD